MKDILLLVFAFILMSVTAIYCESKRDPYEEGMHLDYSISCQDGFVYKTLSERRGTILVLNSDGTPLKCGHKRY